MFCSNCGKKLKEDAKFCNECGTKVIFENRTSNNIQTNTINEIPVSNGKGVASLVLGIISLFIGFFLIPIPIVGLILGIVQKRKNGVAIAGIVINALSLFGIIMLWLLIFIGYSLSTEEISKYPMNDNQSAYNYNSNIVLMD